jgi:hypothetical protein
MRVILMVAFQATNDRYWRLVTKVLLARALLSNCKEQAVADISQPRLEHAGIS